MKRLAALALASSLCACATGQTLPPSVPTIATIGATWAELAASGTPPSALLNIGVTLDDQACGAWFDQQVLGSEQTKFGQSALGLGAAGAALAGGPAGMGAAVGAGMLSALLGAAQTNSPTGADPVMAFGLMQRERQAWLASVSPPATTDIAWSYLQDYHSFCSLSSIRWALAQAVMTTPVVVVPQQPPIPPPIPPVIPPVPPVPPTPPPPGGPIVTPNLRGTLTPPSEYPIPHARRSRGRAAPPEQAFWQQNPPSFALSQGLLAVPPRACVGCGR